MALSFLWNPHHLRPLHVGDDFLGHPNGEVPNPILLANLVSNHLAIALLLDLELLLLLGCLHVLHLLVLYMVGCLCHDSNP